MGDKLIKFLKLLIFMFWNIEIVKKKIMVIRDMYFDSKIVFWVIEFGDRFLLIGFRIIFFSWVYLGNIVKFV